MSAPQVCSACAAESPDGAKFCVECGARLSRACPSCGAPADGFRFCMECGTSLLDVPAPRASAPVSGPTHGAPVSERRTTTVLFGDLVGFTTLAESRDPEEVRELLSAYFAVARTVVGRYGGTIEKFIGDAVMAVWGVPVAHEDDAERAVRAGLDLVAEVAALGERVGMSGLTMRVGLVTGSVAVTLGAVGEGMVAGDAVNTAARVQAAAAPGTVWVDGETRGLTAAAITFSDMGEHELKGKAEPVRLFRADAIVAAVGGAQRVDGLEAPMIGREHEMRDVKELFHATEADGRARLAVVRGVAGVGKSRLGWEFEKYIDGLSDMVRWHRGRCLSYGEGAAYWAFAEMVRSRVGLLEGQSGTEVAEAVRAYLADIAATAEEADWLGPRILALLSAGGAGFDRSDLFPAWSTFLERVGGDRPVVLVFEDMQYAGTGALDLVEYLLESCRAHLFVVLLARPELLDQRPTLLGGRRTVLVDLEPLPEPAMAALVDALVDDLPADARAALVARSEGIPLYAVETVRSLIDHDAVRSHGGRYVFVDHDHALVDLAQLTTPTSLRTLVSARLDALTPDERRVAQDASVLGTTVQLAGLVELSSLSEFEVDAALGGLVRKGILATQDDPRSPERGQYHFLQAIVREVAYDTLSRKDRRERHLAAADHLERTVADLGAVGAVVAQHLLDAVDSAPDDPANAAIRERARRLLAAAADRAEQLGSPQDALRIRIGALELDPDPRERADLLAGTARAALGAGENPRCENTALQAEEAYRALGDDAARLACAVLRCQALIWGGRPHDALALAREVETELADPAVGDHALRIQLFSAMAQAARASDDIETQDAAARRLLHFAERHGTRRDIVAALNTLAVLLIGQGYATPYQALLHYAVGIAREEGALAEVGRSLLNLSGELYLHDHAEAARLAEESFDALRRVGRAEMAEVALANLVMAWWLGGRWDAALERLTEWLDAHEPTATTSMLRLVEGLLLTARGLRMPAFEQVDSEGRWERNAAVQVEALRRLGEGDVSTAAALSAEALLGAFGADMQGDDFEVIWAPTVELQLAAGDLERAAELVDFGAGVVAVWRRRLGIAELARLRGMLAAARGEDAEAQLREALRLHEAYAAPYLLAQTRFELGRWLVARGDTDEGGSLLAAAREAAEQLAATPLVERIDAVTGRVMV